MSEFKVDLPDTPYRGLEHYGQKDRLLLAGRTWDVETCGHFLGEPQTRILLLHGQTGCGKSSFLRAGLIPSLEESGFGYLFLRSYAGDSDSQGAPTFIRCGPDPIGRLAEKLFHFVARPLRVQSAKGVKSVDLSAAHLGMKDVTTFVAECRRPGVMIRVLLALSTIITPTVVVVLDQAEEVITLANSGNEYRGQFFRFIKDFSTLNFPLKIVIALRKDYSGEFIGLAQLGSSMSMFSPPASTQLTEDLKCDPLVKSDIKLFLLRELDRNQVLEAIKLPTSRHPLDDGRESPFDKYMFEYGEEAAEEIADDLFHTASAGASLPVMQIVCRDLFEKVRRNPKPWIIDKTLYLAGDRITGPVDRHISTSIRNSIESKMFDVPADVAEEERKIRLLLYRLVRRESDGSIHSNVVSLAQLQTVAEEAGVNSNVQKVVDYLTRSEALLLRTFSLLSDEEPDERQLFSLGHDVIGVVLHDWKTRTDAEDLARERISKQLKRATTFSVVMLALIAIVAVVLVLAKKHGEDSIVLDVLENTTTNKQREQPLLALNAAVEALAVTDRIHGRLFWMSPSDIPRKRLAHILAGLPVAYQPSSKASDTRTSGRIDDAFPLPKAGGFITIRGRKISIVNVAGESGEREFEVESGDSSIPFIPDRTTVGETAGGDVLLLKEALFVLPAHSKSSARFDKSYFEEKVETYLQKQRPIPIASGTDGRVQVRQRSRSQPLFYSNWLDIFDQTVVLYYLSATELSGHIRHLRTAIISWDPTQPLADPFHVTQVFDRDQDVTFTSGGFPPGGVIVLGDHVVSVEPNVPTAVKALGTSNANGWLLHVYDGAKPNPGPEQSWDMEKVLGRIRCHNELGTEVPCNWSWVPVLGRQSTLMLFGVRDSRTLEKSEGYESQLASDLSSFSKLVFFDIGSGQSAEVDFGDLSAKCMESTPSDELIPDLHGRRHGKGFAMYFGDFDNLLLGMFVNSSVDLVRITKEGEATKSECMGTIYYPDDVQRWALARNHSTLLASGPRAEFHWDLAMTVEQKANEIVNGDLTVLACAAGLTNHELSGQEWVDATGLRTPPAKVCVARK